jgi:outer membrane protein TolC
MRVSALIAAALLLLPSRPGIAQEPLPLAALKTYRPLLEDALRSSPDLLRLRALVEVERTRVPQAGALPDPELSLGVQRRAAMDVVVPNPVMADMPLMGSTPIGTEYSLMATQAFPWPGKRKGRENLARAGLARSEAEILRATMDLEAQLQEGLSVLLRVKAEKGLLADQDLLWAEAEALAKQCCELGTGTQADLLQAMMARARLAQRKLELEAQEDLQKEALNRLAGRPADAPLELVESLERLARPTAPSAVEAGADARRRSPEWALGLQDQQSLSHSLALGRMDLRPDLRVTAGAMKEPGMGTGWKAEVGIALPVFSSRKQGQVVTMREAELGAARAAQAGLERTLDQSLAERLRAWSLSERQLKLYEEALLPQGELALRSLMGQYEGGKVTFQAVLDALNGRLKDRQGRLEALARIHGLAIAQQRVALVGGSGFATGGPDGAMGGSVRPAPTRSASPSAAAAAVPTPKSSSMSM